MGAVTGKHRTPVHPWVRVHRVGALLPAAGQGAIFNVVGGAVLARFILGRLTVDASSTATTVKVTTNPAIGTDVDLCTAVAITSKVAGSLLAANNAAALVVAQGFAIGAGYLIPEGEITIITSADNAAAEAEWWVEYQAVDPNAYVVAA